MNILRLSTLSLTLAIAVITLTIVLGSVTPRIAGAAESAEGINFVTIVQTDLQGLCYTDAHTLGAQRSDAKEEVQAGIELIANTEAKATFKGISREDVARDPGRRNLSPCLIYL